MVTRRKNSLNTRSQLKFTTKWRKCNPMAPRTFSINYGNLDILRTADVIFILVFHISQYYANIASRCLVQV